MRFLGLEESDAGGAGVQVVGGTGVLGRRGLRRSYLGMIGMAREFARNKINVNVICSGPTPTPMLDDMKAEDSFADKVLSSMDKIIPLKRMGTPDDIAAAVVFLASDEAGFITGQVLSVSGGLTMC